MSLLRTSEQAELATALRSLLEKGFGRTELYAVVDDAAGYDAGLYAQLAELGVPGLFVPERWGGGGFTFAETAVVLAEAGRVLLSSPLFATTAAAAVLLSAADDGARGEYLPDICAGRSTATTVGLAGVGTLGVRASDADGGDVLDGEQLCVVDGTTADLLVVTAAAPDGPRLYAVAADAPGVTRTAMQGLDPTRPLARVRLDGVRARRIGNDPAALGQGSALVLAALGAECVGAGEKLLELAVDYAKTRTQFDRPIGSFQAIKHLCTDMLVDLEQSRSAAVWAASAADPADDEHAAFPLAARVAKTFGADALCRIAAGAVQVHGGIGFTWEHPAHLYFRRARASQVLWATREENLDAIADLLAL